MKIKLLLLLFLPLVAQAQETEHTRIQMIGVGSVNLLDTYLSPENYNGAELRYLNISTRESQKHPGISYITTHEAHVSLSHNRADNNDELTGMYNFQFAVHRNWKLLNDKLTLHAGPGIDGNIGMLYNMRNGNNPTQAKISLNIAPSAGASYLFNIKGRPFRASYDAMFPLVGLMFAPNYGQSYYEIFNRGNYDKNIRATTWFSTPSFRQSLALDFNIRKTTFRIAYLGDYQQAKINHLKYHSYSNMLMLGVVSHFAVRRLK